MEAATPKDPMIPAFIGNHLRSGDSHDDRLVTLEGALPEFLRACQRFLRQLGFS